MLGNIARFLSIVFRERPVEMKMGVRYRVTLDLEKVRKSMPVAKENRTADDVGFWLERMGLVRTSKENVWKAEKQNMGRVPKDAILKAEKL